MPTSDPHIWSDLCVLSLDLIFRTLSDFAIHLTVDIISEAASLLSRTLVPAEPVLRILDTTDPLAKLAAKR